MTYNSGNVTLERPLAPFFEQLREDALFEQRAKEYHERTGLYLIGGGAAGAWTGVNTTRTNILNGTLVSGDTYKCALFLSTSNIGAGSTTYAGLTNEHANANGYTTGGVSVTFSLSGTTTVTDTFAVNPTWTASGGPIVARFGVVYEVGGNVLCYCLLDSTPGDVTTTTGNVFTVQANASGVLSLA